MIKRYFLCLIFMAVLPGNLWGQNYPRPFSVDPTNGSAVILKPTMGDMVKEHNLYGNPYTPMPLSPFDPGNNYFQPSLPTSGNIFGVGPTGPFGQLYGNSKDGYTGELGYRDGSPFGKGGVNFGTGWNAGFDVNDKGANGNFGFNKGPFNGGLGGGTDWDGNQFVSGDFGSKLGDNFDAKCHVGKDEGQDPTWNTTLNGHCGPFSGSCSTGSNGNTNFSGNYNQGDWRGGFGGNQDGNFFGGIGGTHGPYSWDTGFNPSRGGPFFDGSYKPPFGGIFNFNCDPNGVGVGFNCEKRY